MVTAIVATVKAGGVYLPLDPAYPAERLAFMVNDAQELGIRFAVKDRFQHPTVHALSRAATAGEAAPALRVAPLALLGESDRARIAAMPEIEDAFPVR